MKSALIIVDVQEDFLPPGGALAVPNGRSVIGEINSLLENSWALKIASRDWHPPDHCSFAVNNNAKEFDTVELKHPLDGEAKPHVMWPVHCVQNTHGAEFAKGFHHDKVDLEIKKGMLQDREYYSAFQDVWAMHHTDLFDILKKHEIEAVYVVGLAMDFCVYHTSLDSKAHGWPTFVVLGATKPVHPEAQGEIIAKLEKEGVQVVDKL